MIITLGRSLYTLLFFSVLPLIYLRLWYQSWRLRAYRYGWRQRLGFMRCSPFRRGVIWIHAVSVGEVVVATPLIRALKTQYPKHPIVVTTMTPTGANQLRATFSETVKHFYLPYDLPFAVNAFLNHLQPRIALFVETELWPNYLHALQQRQIPTLLVNARLSEKSARRYAFFATLSRAMLQQLTHIAVQSSADQQRFVKLGMPVQRMTVTGNIKFDLTVDASIYKQAQELRQSWGADRPVWIAASTHEGEEQQVLTAFSFIRQQLPQCLLVLVPRHPQRFAKVATLCRQQYGEKVVLRSQNQPCSAQTAIFIGDSMGELLLFYAAADVAFVGGSLVAKGGHNMLEPAAVGVAVVSGKQTFNFTAMVRLLQCAQAISLVENTKQLATTVGALLCSPQKRQQQTQAAQQVLAANCGAVSKHLRLIKSIWRSK